MAQMALSMVRKFFPSVAKVKNARANLAVTVTALDNKNASKKNHEGCALAVACKRKLSADGVLIAKSTAYVIKNGTATRFLLPVSAQKEIVSFDRNGGFEEGIYHLSRPPKTQSLGEGNGHSKDGGNKKKTHKGHLRFRHVTGNIRTALGTK